METRQIPPPGEMESQDEDSHQMKKSELVKVSFVMILWNIYSSVCLVWEWFTQLFLCRLGGNVEPKWPGQSCWNPARSWRWLCQTQIQVWPNARERELILFNEILQRNVAERRWWLRRDEDHNYSDRLFCRARKLFKQQHYEMHMKSIKTLLKQNSSIIQLS